MTASCRKLPMFDSNTISRSFSKAAKSYDEHARLQRVVREECIKMGQSVWGEGASVLDAGSGTGMLAGEVKSRGLGWQVTHLDLAPGMCAVARARGLAVVNASAASMPFADDAFDGVFSSLMLQWADEPVKIFKEMARVTRKGGHGVVSTFVEGTLSELRESFAAIDDAAHVNSFASPVSLTALAAHSGFTLLACEEETFTSGHEDVTALMRSLKAIGATAKQGASRKGLMTPSQLKALEQGYRERFAGKAKGKAKKSGLPATWQVLYMLLERQ
jgi:malonyl-CoA O-methyltransferase